MSHRVGNIARMTRSLDIDGVALEFTRGDRLRKARERRGLSQTDFAEELGVARRTIVNYETESTAPKPLVLKMWAMATGVSSKWLETGEIPTTPDGGPDQGVSLTGGKHITPVRELRAA